MSAGTKQIVRRALNLISVRTIVLLYHRIAELQQDPWGLAVRPKHFVEHLEVIRSIGAVRLDQAEPSRVRPFHPRCAVALTFDDGYCDNYRQALPLLEKLEVPATFFITTGYIGQAIPFWWDKLRAVVLGADVPQRVSVSVEGQSITMVPAEEEKPADALRRIHLLVQRLDAVERERAIQALAEAVGFDQTSNPADFAMTEAELIRMAASPFVEIGAHTVTHPSLSAISPQRQFEEIDSSKRCLENLLNRRITSFSYPFGAPMHFTETTEQLVKTSGFQRACTTEDTAFRVRHTSFRMPRLYAPDVDGERFSKWLWSYLKN